MPQIINTNVASLNSQRNLNSSQGSLATALQRLSSGLRINSAKDDAAGLAITQRFTAQINGVDQAARNANDGISLAQTAEGGLNTMGDLLQRIRQLAVQSANGSNSASDRTSLQQEVAQLQQEINRIATSTQFNGMNVLDGSLTSSQFQVGANANQTINVSIGSAKATDIGNFALQTAAVAGTSVEATAAAAGSAANRVVAQNLTIAGNGTSKVAAINAGDSAKAITDAVNAHTASTGVTATAETFATLGNLQTAGTLSFKLQGSNSVAVSISATVGVTSDLSSLASAINAQSAATGITAQAQGGKVTLTSKDGYDIKVSDFLNSAGAGGVIDLTGVDSAGAAVGAAATLGAAAGTDSSTVGGRVKFNSSTGYTVTTSVANTLFAAATPNAGTLASVAAVDVSTVSGSNDAMAVVDAALNTLSSMRGALGAMQNRFSATISNLQITSENLNASRSRTLDADFASETSAMTRAQILQQAGTAMLAQANSLPQNVLSLLRG